MTIKIEKLEVYGKTVFVAFTNDQEAEGATAELARENLLKLI